MRTVAREIGLVALAVGLAACDATDSTSTGTLRDGAPISVAGTTSIAVAGLDGRLVTKATREWATDGIVTRGLADAEKVKASGAPMPYLAITDAHALAAGGANKRVHLADKDRAGNSQDFVIVNGDNGPAKTIVHLENGQVKIAYSFEWAKRRGGWLAKSFAVTVYKDGKPTARITSSNKKLAPSKPSGMLAADDPCWEDIECDPWTPNPPPGGGWSPGSGGTGGSGYDCSCAAELQDYLAAATAFAAATQMGIDAGQLMNPWFWIAAGAAGAYVYILLMRYSACVDRCRQLERYRTSIDAGKLFLASVGPPKLALACSSVMRV